VDRVVLNAMSSSYFSIVLWGSRSTRSIPTRTFVIPWLFDIRFSGFVQRCSFDYRPRARARAGARGNDHIICV